MSNFSPYFSMGIDHIADIHAYDHLLFIASLLLVYSFKDWKSIIVLLSAFTLGHGISLLAAILDFFPLSSAWVEFLIPLSILITAVYHLLNGKGTRKVVFPMALIFGLIHGLAYARTMSSMLSKASDKLIPILAFNLGVEAAQMIFGFLFLFLLFALTYIKGLELSKVRMLIFGVILTLTIQLLQANWLW